MKAGLIGVLGLLHTDAMKGNDMRHPQTGLMNYEFDVEMTGE